MGQICSFFLIFFFDFLSYEGIYCAGGHFDPLKVRRVNQAYALIFEGVN